MKPYLRARSIACLDGHYVKPVRSRFHPASTQELPGRPEQVAPLFGVDGLFGRGQRRIPDCSPRYRPGLDLDEGKHGAVVADHIDLALETGKRVVAGYQDVALASQIPIGKRFSSNAGLEGSLFGRLEGRLGRVCGDSFR
jgi:hypothetical protein